jgi:type I restriction-modification system DNA methylase subunit
MRESKPVNWITAQKQKMARTRSTASRKAAKDSTANLGFEQKLWLTADKFRNSMDAADWSGARKAARPVSPMGHRDGVHQFFTPSCVVRCLVEMLAPYNVRTDYPAGGSGLAMAGFVPSE